MELAPPCLGLHSSCRKSWTIISLRFIQMMSNVKVKSFMLAIPLREQCCYIWCFCNCEGPIFFDFLGFFNENGKNHIIGVLHGVCVPHNHRLKEIMDLPLILYPLKCAYEGLLRAFNRPSYAHFKGFS